MTRCRCCDDATTEFLDLGRQPLSDSFRTEVPDDEFCYDLRVAQCDTCQMVQLVAEVPREQMFTSDYPFLTSTSSGMVRHFTATATWLRQTWASGPDPFVVEMGSNDGTMLATLAELGVRHLGVDPAADAGVDAAARGVATLTDFFEARTALAIAAEHGPADVVFAANTLCHIPYLDEIFAGLDALLRPDGVFVFEDPYLGDIVRLGSFDQIYDEHFYLFSATSVARLAARHGFELVDVAPLPTHGGEVRYTLARTGRQPVSPAVTDLIEAEVHSRLHDLDTLRGFAAEVARRRGELVARLTEFRDAGVRVAGYAATAKSATVLNYCGIGPDLVPVVYDTTPAKQGRLTPGSHIPVRPFPALDDAPDVYLLFAWNHAEEIMAKEEAFAKRGGRWLRYVPDVTVT